jgi:purine-cytosine permease-like protein
MNQCYHFRVIGSFGVPLYITLSLQLSNTTNSTLYTDGVSLHPVMNDSSPRPYCLLLHDHRID